MIKVLFVCHGNICRSPMAQSVFAHLAQTQRLADHFQVDSAATSREEIGNSPHYGVVAKLREMNIPLIPHRAIQITKKDYQKYDYLIGMDEANIRNIIRIVGGDPKGKIYKLLYFAGSSADVVDPWYSGDFDATYRDVLAGCQGFLDYALIHYKRVGETKSVNTDLL